jgi:hypothetical protein
MINGVVEVVLQLDELNILAYKSKGSHFVAFQLCYRGEGRVIMAHPILAGPLGGKPARGDEQFNSSEFFSSVFSTSTLAHSLREHCRFQLEIPMSEHASLLDIEIELHAKVLRTGSGNYFD